MAELKIYLSEGLNERFRRIAMRVHGYGRGSFSKAAEEALAKWCSEHEPSAVHAKESPHSGIVEGQLPKETESHINPDERQTADHSAKGIDRDNPPTATGSSS